MRSRMSLELESRWWTLGGAEVLDMMSTVGALVRSGQTVHIGTDAQKTATRMEFVTVACVLNPGKGGRVYYTRRHDRKDATLFEKLSTETWLSLDLALRMVDAFKLSPDQKQIWVHVDANPDERFDSSDYVKQLAGMVAGSGFPVLVKPNAWCASHVADYAVKGKHFRARMNANAA
ncbi:MAG: ribonuclease H-like YkuK family protein [Myxococcota bacterium]